MTVDLDTDFDYGFSQVGQNLNDPSTISDRSSAPSSKSIFSGNRSLNFLRETSDIKVPSACDERMRVAYMDNKTGVSFEGGVKGTFGGPGKPEISVYGKGEIYDKHRSATGKIEYEKGKGGTYDISAGYRKGNARDGG